jgi:transcription antitermination protein NusB
MSRRDAREKAFMLLYQMEIQKGGEDAQIEAFIAERDVGGNEVAYMTQLVNGVRTCVQELDGLFTPYLKRWTKERLPKIDLTILRLAVFEMFHVPDVPHNVAISEAVLLCKKYSSEESRSYINAVLGRLSSSPLLPAKNEPGADAAAQGAGEPQ